MLNDIDPFFLAPVSADQFFAEYFGRKRLALHRGDPGFFRDTLGMAELDRLVASTRIPLANFNLAKDNNPLPFDQYASGGSYVDKARALDLHQAGATIILRSLEQWSPGLARLRVAAETAFRCEAQANVYLTPPSQKSTPPHWDTHDLFVLQIEGEKVWRIFQGERSLPLDDERFEVGHDVVSADYEEILLRPGDTLYLPRGVIHEPVAESYSVHVALGVHVVRWFDVVSLALRKLAEREGSLLREAVPGWRGDLDPVAARDMVEGLLDPALLAQASGVLRRRFQATRASDLEGRLLDIRHGPRLEPEARYARRGGLALKAATTGQGVRIAAGGREVSVGHGLGEAVEFILANQSFAVKELPGQASLEERAALCAALHEIGVLTSPAPAHA
jgi:ribosomal protein L16 Arg81 hydroxylase